MRGVWTRRVHAPGIQIPPDVKNRETLAKGAQSAAVATRPFFTFF